MYELMLKGNNFLFEDFVELREHLEYNGYKSKFNQGHLFVPEEEFCWVGTILHDRGFKFEVVSYQEVED